MTHRARKRFGQNFLQDTSIIDSILIAATPECNEHWVEIGPGQGALTAPLLRTGDVDGVSKTFVFNRYGFFWKRRQHHLRTAYHTHRYSEPV